MYPFSIPNYFQDLTVTLRIPDTLTGAVINAGVDYGILSKQSQTNPIQSHPNWYRQGIIVNGTVRQAYEGHPAYNTILVYDTVILENRCLYSKYWNFHMINILKFNGSDYSAGQFCGSMGFWNLRVNGKSKSASQWKFEFIFCFICYFICLYLFYLQILTKNICFIFSVFPLLSNPTPNPNQVSLQKADRQVCIKFQDRFVSSNP